MNKAGRNVFAAAALMCCLPLVPYSAGAHARLVAATPAAGATVAAPRVIKVRFNEAIEAGLSALKLFAGGREVAAAAVPDPADPAELAIAPAAALPPGDYRVTWSAVSRDGHRTKGVYVFRVK